MGRGQETLAPVEELQFLDEAWKSGSHDGSHRTTRRAEAALPAVCDWNELA